MCTLQEMSLKEYEKVLEQKTKVITNETLNWSIDNIYVILMATVVCDCFFALTYTNFGPFAVVIGISDGLQNGSSTLFLIMI